MSSSQDKGLVHNEDKDKPIQATDDMSTFYQWLHKYTSTYFERRKENEKALKDFTSTDEAKTLRDNLRVLIIVGSILKIKHNPRCGKVVTTENGEKTFVSRSYIAGKEDYVTAMLIAHIFKYGLRIPSEHIVVTCSNSINYGKNTNLSPSRGDPKPSPQKIFDASIDISNLGIIYAQIGSEQYSFIPDNAFPKIIKPFNTETLKSLKTDDKSEVIVFFLDHGTKGSFGPLHYRHFIERFNSIPAKHFTVFNQSCKSGSLIKLLKISEEFRDVFGDLTSEPQASENIFLTLDKISIQQKTCEGITFDYSKIFGDRYNPSEENNKKISSILQDISHFDNVFSIIPDQFYAFKNKADVFCSCEIDMDCTTLPLREFEFMGRRTISAFGGVYISAVLKCLLNKSTQYTSSSQLASQLNNEFKSLKAEFRDIIIEQNTYDEITELGNEDEIQKEDGKEKQWETKLRKDSQGKQNQSILEKLNKYFTLSLESEGTYSSSGNPLPNLSSLLLDEQYWNVDITTVDKKEYEGQKINYYLEDDYKEKERKLLNAETNPNHYGPLDESNFGKFYMDMETAVNQKMEEKNIGLVFDSTPGFHLEATLDEDAKEMDMKVRRSVIPILPNNLVTPFGYLDDPIQYFFHENKLHANIDQCIECFVDAYKEIFQYWKSFKFESSYFG